MANRKEHAIESVILQRVLGEVPRAATFLASRLVRVRSNLRIDGECARHILASQHVTGLTSLAVRAAPCRWATKGSDDDESAPELCIALECVERAGECVVTRGASARWSWRRTQGVTLLGVTSGNAHAGADSTRIVGSWNAR